MRKYENCFLGSNNKFKIFLEEGLVLYPFENIREQDFCQFLVILFTKKYMANSPGRFAGFVLLHLSWNTAGGADPIL